MSLEGKTIILFGAGAIAEGYAPLFADKATNVVIVSRGGSCDELVKRVKRRENARISGEVIAMHADAVDFNKVGEVYDQAVKRFGRVDVVINGAGGNKKEATVQSLDDFINMDPKVAESMIATNYLSKHYSLQHFARCLKKGNYQGSTVNITSMSGLCPLSKVIDYSAAFAAVESFTKSIAHLFGVTRIGRVNNVAVGFTIGEQNRKLLLNEDGTPTPRGKEILAGTSAGRFLEAKEIAPHVLYLADNEMSGVINGQTLRVDSGYGLVGLPGSAGYNPVR